MSKCDLGTIAFAAGKVSNGTGRGINEPSGQAGASKLEDKERSKRNMQSLPVLKG